MIAAVVVSFLALHSAQLYSSALNSSYNQIMAYNRMVKLAAFAEVANESGRNISTPMQYQNWKAAVEVSAAQDRITLSFTNSTLVMSEGGSDPLFTEISTADMGKYAGKG